MAFRHGKNTGVLFGAYDLSSYFKSASAANSVDTAEATGFGSTAKGYVVGLKNGTANVEGMFDGSVGAVDEALSAAFTAGVGKPTTITPDGYVVGRRAHLLSSLSSTYEVDSPIGDVVSVKGMFQADGGIDFGFLLSSAVIAATGNGPAVDNTTATTNGGVAHLHIPANTSNGTIVVKVQHSTDNITFVDLVTFTTVVAATPTSERVAVAPGTTVNRYVRASYTLAGTTGSATIAVAFARR